MAASQINVQYFALQKASLLPIAKFVCRSDILNIRMSLYSNAAIYAGRILKFFLFNSRIYWYTVMHGLKLYV
jgi:hypothetical protein